MSIFSRAKRDDRQDKAARGHSVASATSTIAPSVSSKSPQTTFCTRLVKLDDYALAALTLDTKLSIDWRSVMLSARVGPARWRPVERRGDFAVYTRNESQRFSVLAVGMVPGCVGEILNVLQSHNSAQYAQQMESVFEDQFRDGSFVHRVDVANERIMDRTYQQDGATLADLSVKTVTFNKAGWLSHHEEWCYADAVYRHENGVVEKFFTTLHPKDIVAGLSSSKTKYFHDVVCGYWLRPGTDDATSNQSDGTPTPRGTCVTFYAEYQTPKQLVFSRRHSLSASDKTIKQRLVKLAESTERLTALVRRQRLGVQVLIDGNRFLPPLNTPCKVCTTVVMLAKQCRLCGHAVCADCSNLHERARQSRAGGVMVVTRVRVCAQCIERVDQAEYAHLSASSLRGPIVVPDVSDGEPAATVLKDLLQNALSTAPSPTHWAGVLSVIKCVLDQEHFDSDRDSEVVEMLGNLALDSRTELRSDDHRTYQFDAAGASEAIPAPVAEPETESARLEAVSRVSLEKLKTSAELEILCDVAAKEMGCSSSMIAIIDRDTFHVVASNTPELREVAFSREVSMCTHTIMEKSPLIVKHPEADIRFNRLPAVNALCVRYYCGFPLVGENDQIIGAMCCINNASMDITESQFVAFKKLTTTASKIVRLESTRRWSSSDARAAVSA